jgi:hypothetical protein
MTIDIVTDEQTVPTPSTGKVEMYVLEEQCVSVKPFRRRSLRVKYPDGTVEVVAKFKVEAL